MNIIQQRHEAAPITPRAQLTGSQIATVEKALETLDRFTAKASTVTADALRANAALAAEKFARGEITLDGVLASLPMLDSGTAQSVAARLSVALDKAQRQTLDELRVDIVGIQKQVTEVIRERAATLENDERAAAAEFGVKFEKSPTLSQLQAAYGQEIDLLRDLHEGRNLTRGMLRRFLD
jgi:hypothetical protein